MKTFPFLFAICASIFAITAVCAEDNVIWQIGSFDGNGGDFAISQNYSLYSTRFPNDVTFRPGKDNPSKSWPYIHPGTIDLWSGSREHPFTIIFDIAHKPVGQYRLSIALASIHPDIPPTYEIDINGKSGRIKLPRGKGDLSPNDTKTRAFHSIDITLSSSFFKQGENRIILKCLSGSWVTYDALRLSNNPDSTSSEPTVNNISLSPTVRFVDRDGKLKQVVNLSAEFSSGAPEKTVTYSVGSKKYSSILKPDIFGFSSAELEIDEVKSPVKMTASIESGGQTKTAECLIKPQKHWKVYVQASAHVDIGYTDIQPNIIKRHNENTSTALDLMNKYPDFKWNIEAAWVEDNYLSLMPQDRKDEFIKRAKEGRLGCETIYGNMLTGICSHEEFIRDLYYSHNTARKYGIPFDMAMSSDVPTQIGTLPTVLAGSGIEYFSTGLNLTRGNSYDKLIDKSPFYWQGPDGSRVLTWLAPGYGFASIIGISDSIDTTKTQVENFLDRYINTNYAYDAVLAFGGFADNMPINPLLASVTHEWNKRYAYPKIILSRGPEFFEYMESRYKDKLPTYKGDAGVYWEDGAASSAFETSLNRRSKEDIVAAEKMFALKSAIDGSPYPVDKLNAAWKDAILYDEHTWGAWCSIDQPESEQTVKQWDYKANFAKSAYAGALNLRDSALNNLAESVDVSEQSVLLFNPHCWTVSGPVIKEGPGHDTVQFWAENIPPMGYKLVSAASIAHTAPQVITSGGIENNYYRIEIDPATGAIKSLFDKELNRELADQTAKYGVNQYIYIAGQGTGEKDVTRNSDTQNVQIVRTQNDYSTILDISGSAYNTPFWTSRIVLYNNAKRIDFLNTLDKTATNAKEAGYFAFPFALNKPKFHVELPDGVISPNTDMLPGACMSWYCAQDYVAAADDRSAVVWTAIDSPLVTIGDINRDTFQSPLPIDNGHLYAYVYNNYWFTNYKASQGGKLQFRFSLTSMKDYDPVTASQFGQSVRSPLLAVDCSPKRSSGEYMLSKSEASLCAVSPSNVYIQSVKKPESGNGLIIRLRELSGKQTEAVVTLPFGKFSKASACNLVEDPQKSLKIVNGKVTIAIPARGLATVLLR